jgi:Porin subfamily
MRNTLLAILIAVLATSVAAAEQPGNPKPDKPVSRLLPLKRDGAANACAAYGAGFIKLEGTDTCMRIGGNVSIEARGRR